MVGELESVSTLHECFEKKLTAACKEKSGNMHDIQVKIASLHKANHLKTFSAVEILCGKDTNCTKDTLYEEWLSGTYTSMASKPFSEDLVEQVTGLCGYLEF